MLKIARSVKKLQQDPIASEDEGRQHNDLVYSHNALLHHSANDDLHTAKETEEIKDRYGAEMKRNECSVKASA